MEKTYIFIAIMIISSFTNDIVSGDEERWSCDFYGGADFGRYFCPEMNIVERAAVQGNKKLTHSG
jgi:hypothetical protein